MGRVRKGLNAKIRRRNAAIARLKVYINPILIGEARRIITSRLPVPSLPEYPRRAHFGSKEMSVYMTEFKRVQAMRAAIEYVRLSAVSP